MKEKIGFFDTCSRELGEENFLDFRPRIRPIGDKLNKLYKYIKDNNHILIFTTCCGGNLLKQDSRDDTLFVPVCEMNSMWKEKLSEFNQIYLEKIGDNSPELKALGKNHEVFNENGNSSELLKLLGIKKWVVFGNSIDFCIDHTVKSLLKSGYDVIFLFDVMVSGATGHGISGTEENKRRLFEEWCTLGAKRQSLDEFLEKIKFQ
jgi:nicotinamidase-related amidase